MKLPLFKKQKKEVKKKPVQEEAVEPIQEKTESAAPLRHRHNAGPVRAIIQYPFVSEKSSRLSAMGQYVFRVYPNANKSEIKKEVSTRYGVHVHDVKIIRTPEKRRDVGRHPGVRPGYKKAIVVLAPGESITSIQP